MDGTHRLLSKTVWDDYGLRDDLHVYVNEHPADPDGVLVLDETGSWKYVSTTTGGTCDDGLVAQTFSQTSTWLARGFGSERPRMFDGAVTSPPTGPWSTPGGWGREQLARRPLAPHFDGEHAITSHLRCTLTRTSDDDLHRRRGGDVATRRRTATS
ncbi:hypothetical protein [Nocardia sp. NPDC050793]|uniref:hypothetical protein n=1 Tax=Nocardia sp. NPDC050793 TaxID=3155159 RepID=UPI0033BFC682